MNGEWMDGGDLWTLIPLSYHSFHSSITLILFSFHSIHSHSLSFWHFLSLYPINTHFHSIHIYITPIPYYRSLHVHFPYHWGSDGGGVNYSIHSLLHYSYSCITVTSFIHSTTICHHSLSIHSISSLSYSFHITSFIYHTSLSLPLSLDYLSLISLAILVHSLFHSIILFHSIHSHTPHIIHHSILSVLNTIYSIHLLSSPYTLHYHHVSFIDYSIHSTTHFSSNLPSLKTHSHYPSITLIYYSISIPFSILYHWPQSLHLIILFIKSYTNTQPYHIQTTIVSINHSILTTLFHSSIYLFSFHIYLTGTHYFGFFHVFRHMFFDIRTSIHKYISVFYSYIMGVS